MKKSDVASLILIIGISVLAAYFVASTFIKSPSGQQTKVKTVDQISADIKQPDTSVFNDDAINPTVEVIVGED